MHPETFIKEWLEAANNFDTKSFLAKWHENALLDDPSVGAVFKGQAGIREYFEDYFIGYKTQTRLIKLVVLSKDKIHLEVEFTGTFPGGKVGGVFDLFFKEGKIAKAKAELL